MQSTDSHFWGAPTHSLLWPPSSASCSLGAEGGSPFDPHEAKQKVTLFWGDCTLTSSSVFGLHSARLFHRMAQRFTTLWRCRDLCGNIGRLDYKKKTGLTFDVWRDAKWTNLLLAVLRQARREVTHVSGIREDARHALPQQLVSVDLSRSGRLLLFPPLLCDLQPPSMQHLQASKKKKTVEAASTNLTTQWSRWPCETFVQGSVTLAWRVRDQCQSARSVWLASLRLCCSCLQEGNPNPRHQIMHRSDNINLFLHNHKKTTSTETTSYRWNYRWLRLFISKRVKQACILQ